MAYSFKELPVTNSRVSALMADFSGMKDLDERVNKVLDRLWEQTSGQKQAVWSGNMSVESFDGMFSELVRKELGKTLAVIRAKAVAKARAAGAGSASTAIHRRMYKDELAGAVTIGGSRGRISSRKRLYEPGTKKPRYVSDRTRNLNEYYGPDRHFVLRFLEYGTDVRTAKTFGPTGRGSTASWGARGAIAPRPFFHTMSSDMEQAAQQLGQTLTGYVEKWIEKKLKEE